MTRRSLSNRAPFTRHRLLGARVAVAVQDTSRQAKASRRKTKANARPPRKPWKSVRFTPVAATSIVMSMSETRRSGGNPRVSSPRRECTARLAGIRRHLDEIVQSIGTLHIDGRRIDMHV